MKKTLVIIGTLFALYGATANAVGVPTCAIQANSDHITQGGSSALSWMTTDATSASIDQIGAVPVSGMVDVRPPVTTTYTMTVSGVLGSASCSRTVYVSDSVVAGTVIVAPSYTYVPQPATDAPYCSVSATPTVAYGGAATITWNCSNAYAVTIEGVGSFAGTGSYVLSPVTASREVRMLAQGQGGVRVFTSYVSVVQPASVPPTYYGNEYYYTSVQSNGASTYTPSYTQQQYAYPRVSPVAASHTVRPASPVVYVGGSGRVSLSAAQRSVRLSSVPYTGAEDVVVPFFLLAGAVSMAYTLRRQLTCLA